MNEKVQIIKKELIGSGTQADVYTCKIKNSPMLDEIYVTKTKKIIGNQEIAS